MDRIQVLLGADAIDLRGFACSTVGSLPLALAARHFGAKVHVLAEPGKIRRNVECAPLTNPNDRLANDPDELLASNPDEWLASDPALMRALKQGRIETVKPLNDCISGDLVTSFVPPLAGRKDPETHQSSVQRH